MSRSSSHKENINNLSAINVEQKDSQLHFQDQQSKKAVFLYQYKLTQIYCPQLGIYPLPNLQNFRIWNCIIFIRSGFYKEAKLKFDLQFPQQFPQKPPKIIFKSTVYHPLVNQNTGQIDLNLLLKINSEKWNYLKNNMLYHLMTTLRSMFLQRSFYEYQKLQDLPNAQAARVFLENPHQFIHKSLTCVQQSQYKLFQNQQGSSLIIKQYQQGQLQEIKKKLSQLCNFQGSTIEKSRKLFKYFSS